MDKYGQIESQLKEAGAKPMMQRKIRESIDKKRSEASEAAALKQTRILSRTISPILDDDIWYGSRAVGPALSHDNLLTSTTTTTEAGRLSPKVEELRIDPNEGLAFTKGEFMEFYRGSDEWDAAEVYHPPYAPSLDSTTQDPEPLPSDPESEPEPEPEPGPEPAREEVMEPVESIADVLEVVKGGKKYVSAFTNAGIHDVRVSYDHKILIHTLWIANPSLLLTGLTCIR